MVPLFILRSCYQLAALLPFSVFHFFYFISPPLRSLSLSFFLSFSLAISISISPAHSSSFSPSSSISIAKLSTSSHSHINGLLHNFFLCFSHFQFQFSPYKLSRNYCIRTENEPHFYDSFGSSVFAVQAKREHFSI